MLYIEEEEKKTLHSINITYFMNVRNLTSVLNIIYFNIFKNVKMSHRFKTLHFVSVIHISQVITVLIGHQNKQKNKCLKLHIYKN